MKIKLGGKVLSEKTLNEVITRFADRDDAVNIILADYALTQDDIAPIEVEYIKARIYDVRDGKKLQKSW